MKIRVMLVLDITEIEFELVVLSENISFIYTVLIMTTTSNYFATKTESQINCLLKEGVGIFSRWLYQSFWNSPGEFLPFLEELCPSISLRTISLFSADSECFNGLKISGYGWFLTLIKMTLKFFPYLQFLGVKYEIYQCLQFVESRVQNPLIGENKSILKTVKWL